MAASIALARAKITRAGAVVHDRVQVTVRAGTMRIVGGGHRGDVEGVTSLVQSSPSVWEATFEDGDVLTIERQAKRCGSCAGRR
jgi:hypothetical protein